MIYIQQRLHCGATLINNKYVTTAGHCVKWYQYNNTVSVLTKPCCRFLLQDLTVGLGKHDRLNRRRGVTREISARIVHKHFTSDAVHDTNDIALVKMTKPVVFGVNIAPACLPHPRRLKGSYFLAVWLSALLNFSVGLRGTSSDSRRMGTYF